MKAYRITEQGSAGTWDDVPMPTPADDEVLIQMTAAGLCRSDLEVIDHGVEFLPWQGPFTLGHENVGWVKEVGAHITDLSVGESVVVTAASSCGTCDFCLTGRDNFCLIRPRSYGIADDGGLAPFMTARRRDVLPIGGLDHRVAAPLGDAGATAYGAIDEIRPYLRDEGFVVVIGVGGVGSLTVQLLKLLTSATVIAVDHRDRLDLAQKAGADELIPAGEEAAELILNVTGPQGADVIIDVVGNDQTLALAARLVRQLGAIAVVGTAGGTFPFGFTSQNFGARVFSSITCSLSQLKALFQLAERGLLNVEYESYDFDDLERGYNDLRAGLVRGRPVVLFPGEQPA